MARPIKATPRLSGKVAYDFQRTLKQNEDKEVVISFRKTERKIRKKILDAAPKW